MLINNDYHLVISDVMMPEMDGFSLLRLIKKNPELNHIPVILLTSKADQYPGTACSGQQSYQQCAETERKVHWCTAAKRATGDKRDKE